MTKKAQHQQSNPIAAHITPGPWSVANSYEQDQIAIRVDGDDSLCVAVALRCYPEDGDNGEDMANARLIAAAPELLSEHTEMLGFIRGYAESADKDDPVHEMLSRYEATNAKATGA